MLIKSYETRKINLYKNPFVLLYGKNEGFKKEVKNNLLKNKNITVNLEENEILENPNNFIESLLTKSLFEEEKIIFINRITDKFFKIFAEIWEKKIEKLIIIIDSDNLEKKSKLRSFFEKDKNCICVPFYPDTKQTLSSIAIEYLKMKKIPISNSNLNMIVNKCNGDRKNLLMELEKIELYARAGKKIDTDSLTKLTNLIENHSISELVDNCLAKNHKKTIHILNENNFSTEDCIVITRIFLNKLKKILKLSTDYEKNKDLNKTISDAKPPIFWKDKDIVRQQINKLNSNEITRLIFKINEIELQIKKNNINSVHIISDFIYNQSSLNTNNDFL